MRALPLPALLLAGAALAQNRDHPGLVCAGRQWLTPAEAAAKGFFLHQGRWVPQALRPKLQAWEKDDAKAPHFWKLDSKHYRITTSLPRFRMHEEIVPFLDALFETYVQVFARDFGISGKTADKKFIRIYSGYAEYAAQAGRQGGGPPPRSTPGFIMGGSELVVYYEETDPALFYGTVFHEGAHQFFQAALPGAALPQWLDEALATYFEGCSWSRCDRKLRVEHLPPERVLFAREELRKAGPSATPETMFMRVTGNAFEARHYALSWSFIYYLTHAEGGKHRAGFFKFLQAMNGSGVRPVGDVFRRATGRTLEELSAGWRDWVLALKAGELPYWVLLEVTGADPRVDLKSDDRVWSLDGVEVYDARTFEQLWSRRPKDRPVEVVVVRRESAPAPAGYQERFVTATIPPDARVELGVRASETRTAGLRD